MPVSLLEMCLLVTQNKNIFYYSSVWHYDNEFRFIFLLISPTIIEILTIQNRKQAV